MAKNIFEKAANADSKRTDKMFSKHNGNSELLKKEVRDEFIKAGEIIDIPLTSILDDTTFQMRTETVSDDAVSEMADSIKRYTQLVPVFARPLNGKYQLIAGFTRFKACKKAGVKTIKAIVQKVNDDKASIIADVENGVRNELQFIDIYTRIKKLSETHEPKLIAERLGRDVRTIQYYLQIGQNEKLVKLIHKGITSFKESIKLIRLEPAELNKAISKLETLTNKKEAKEEGKKAAKEQGPVYINKSKDKIKINLSGRFQDKDEIIKKLKEILKSLENIK